MSLRLRAVVFPLAFLVSLRMFGLFIAMPVLSIYGAKLEGATSALVGLSIGIYGLAQICAQIPMGFLADKIGRKPVIYMGLSLFTLGSIVAAMSDSIYGVLLGRLLQGTGAISGAVLALISDLTLEEHRTKSMAVVGMSIGLSFMLALFVGPYVANEFALHGIFWLTSILAILGMAVCKWVVPDVIKGASRSDASLSDAFKHILSPWVFSLNLSVLFLHMTMSAVFFVLPLVLLNKLSIPLAGHGKIYLAFILSSFLLIVPLVFYAERKRKIRFALLGSIALIMLGLMVLQRGDHYFMFAMAGAFLYFAGFNSMESLLPSMISKEAPAALKGTVMGVFSTCQFLGAFLGGVLAGWISAHYGITGVWFWLSISAAIWFAIIFALSFLAPKKVMVS